MNAPFSLSFEHEFQYRPIPGFAPSQVFPAIPIGLIGPKHAVDTIAVIDTGATYSLFSGLRAPAIGLELSAGKRIHLASLFSYKSRVFASSYAGAIWDANIM